MAKRMLFPSSLLLAPLVTLVIYLPPSITAASTLICVSSALPLKS